MRPRLTVFAKAPRMGTAKTRLAADTGPARAMRLYRAMTARILRRVQDPRWETVLAVPDHDLAARVPEWPAVLPRAGQGGGDLGARQARMLDRPFSVVIGTDTPDVSARDIARAFTSLRRHAAVIGPAEDGGYWLLGLRRPARADLFEGVPWSSDETLSVLEARLPRPIMRLETRRDIDEGADL